MVELLEHGLGHFIDFLANVLSNAPDVLAFPWSGTKKRAKARGKQ